MSYRINNMLNLNIGRFEECVELLDLLPSAHDCVRSDIWLQYNSLTCLSWSSTNKSGSKRLMEFLLLWAEACKEIRQGNGNVKQIELNVSVEGIRLIPLLSLGFPTQPSLFNTHHVHVFAGMLAADHTQVLFSFPYILFRILTNKCTMFWVTCRKFDAPLL